MLREIDFNAAGEFDKIKNKTGTAFLSGQNFLTSLLRLRSKNCLYGQSKKNEGKEQVFSSNSNLRKDPNLMCSNAALVGWKFLSLIHSPERRRHLNNLLLQYCFSLKSNGMNI